MLQSQLNNKRQKHTILRRLKSSELKDVFRGIIAGFQQTTSTFRTLMDLMFFQ